MRQVFVVRNGKLVEITPKPTGSKGFVVKNYRHRALGLPTKHAWKDSTGRGHPAKRFDRENVAIMETRREVEEFQAECRARGIPLAWDQS